ncbi:hypothetical protein GE061_005225 [Apolygus lucorum]|uniref:Rubicon Homology domain-containing protein n=1 Tax=Apolygus lucorum TaxID=248454 RepID=A0A6A4IUQ9_APOLU|nr:hypothetical protein GE061_005225 [Apolygus lucorum]
MREELLHMKHYIATCRVSLETGFLKELEWGNSLIHSTELFSLEDLIAVKEGTFLPQIEAIHQRLRTHIKSTCEVCRGRGFHCLYCHANDTIFPFDPETSICPECSTVLHKHCAYKSPDCPKCLRKKRAQSSSE